MLLPVINEVLQMNIHAYFHSPSHKTQLWPSQKNVNNVLIIDVYIRKMIIHFD